MNSRDVSAAVVFYGAPPSPIEMLDNLAGQCWETMQSWIATPHGPNPLS